MVCGTGVVIINIISEQFYTLLLAGLQEVIINAQLGPERVCAAPPAPVLSDVLS